VGLIVNLFLLFSSRTREKEYYEFLFPAFRGTAFSCVRKKVDNGNYIQRTGLLKQQLCILRRKVTVLQSFFQRDFLKATGFG